MLRGILGHAIDASRGLRLGGPVAEPVTMTLLWGGTALVVLGPLAAWAYRRRM